MDGGGGLGNIHDEANEDRFFAFGRQILEGVVAKLVGEVEIKGSGGGVGRFVWVRSVFQKVDLGNSSPRRYNQVRPDAWEGEEVIVMDHMSVHL